MPIYYLSIDPTNADEADELVPTSRLGRFNTEGASLLLSTHRLGGRDNSRWYEWYRSARGAYVLLYLTGWEGETDEARLTDEGEVLRALAFAPPDQRTAEGEALLAQHLADFDEV